MGVDEFVDHGGYLVEFGAGAGVEHRGVKHEIAATMDGWIPSPSTTQGTSTQHPSGRFEIRPRLGTLPLISHLLVR